MPKSAIPLASGGVLPRTEVRRALDSDAALVVVRGGQGAGRTTAVAEWARSASGERLWLSVDGASEGREGFWDALSARLAATDALAPGNPLRESVGTFASVAELRRLITRGVSALVRPVTVIVDDFDRITDPGVADDLVAALASSTRLRVIVTTTTVGVLESDAVRVSLDVAVVPPSAFPFSYDEIARLLGDAGIAEDDALIDAILAATGGHALRVRAVLDLVQRERIAPEQLPERVKELGAGLLRVALAGADDPEQIAFGARISMADRLTPELARKLSGREDASDILEQAERRGFITRLAGPNPVYVIDSTVREALQEELHRSYSAELKELARTVALDDLESGRTMSALRLALAADDMVLATRACELGFNTLTDAPAELAEILGARPLTDYRSHPILAMITAFAYFHHDPRRNRVKAVEAVIATLAFTKFLGNRLEPAERFAMTVAECAAARGLGRSDSGVVVARRAARTLNELDLDARDNLRLAMGPLCVQLGLSLYYGGAPGEAIAVLQRIASLTRQENPTAHFEGNAVIAAIHAFEGDLPRARETAGRLREPDWPRELRHGMLGIGAEAADAMLALEDGDYDEAVARSQATLDRQPTQEHWPWFVRVRSLALLAQGEQQEALELLEADREAEGYLPIGRVMTSHINATKALLLAAQGRLGEARATLAGEAKAIAPELARARILLLQDDAEGALARLHRFEPETQGLRHWVDVLLLRAVCGHRMGRQRLRDDNLTRALVLMADLGLRQPFALLSPSDRAALLDAAGPHIAPELIAELRAMRAEWPEPGVGVMLTEREHDVLALLVRGEGRPGIAAELGISQNTVKTQLRALYRKLGVSTRDEAVQKAGMLGIVDEAD